MTVELTVDQIAVNRAVFAWCIRNSRRSIRRRRYIQATRWCQLAAEAAGFGCGLLSSRDIESLLLSIAQQLPTPSTKGREAGRSRRLHVMSRTDSVGGHNALVKRWIESNPGREQHSVVVLNYMDPAEKGLAEAVERTGGTFHYLGDLYGRPLDCARRLRELAWRDADLVVLHHHMWDVIPAIAFGIPDGPPVLLVNMADHLFWPGAATADLVLQLRPESITLTERYRGINRNYLLAVPLPGRSVAVDVDAPDVRALLGIPAPALVFLTIGRPSKYEPREGVDFLSSAIEILRQIDGAFLVAVGPTLEHPDWRRAYEATRGRLIAVGTQLDLGPYHSAADIYLEGFPFGSLTALLEAGLAGLPCVRAPGIVPPIFRSTGPAIEDLPVPADEAAYVSAAVALAKLPAGVRKVQGSLLAGRIDHFHRSGWARQLADIPMPDHHRVYPLDGEPMSLPLGEAKMLRWTDGDTFEFIRWKASILGVAAAIDHQLAMQALRQLPNTNLLRKLFSMLTRPACKVQTKYIS